MSTTTSDLQRGTQASVAPGPTVTVSPTLTHSQEGYVNVDTVPGVRGNGTTYEHTRISVGTGLGGLVVPVTKARGMTYLGLVRQHRPAIGDHTWEFPRGGTKDLSAAEANRELVEETGLIVPTATLRLLGATRPDTGILTTEVGVWAAPVPTNMVALAHGHVENESGASVSWMATAQVVGLISTGRLICSMSLAAFALAQAAGELNHVP